MLLRMGGFCNGLLTGSQTQKFYEIDTVSATFLRDPLDFGLLRFNDVSRKKRRFAYNFPTMQEQYIYGSVLYWMFVL